MRPNWQWEWAPTVKYNLEKSQAITRMVGYILLSAQNRYPSRIAIKTLHMRGTLTGNPYDLLFSARLS